MKKGLYKIKEECEEEGHQGGGRDQKRLDKESEKIIRNKKYRHKEDRRRVAKEEDSEDENTIYKKRRRKETEKPSKSYGFNRY